MKLIKLYSKKYPGLFTQVDDEDYEWLNKYRWNVSCHKRLDGTKRYYVLTKFSKKMYYMHRLIFLNYKQVDHKDHNTLNNQRLNLRKSNHSLNAMNKRKKSNTNSKYKCVCWFKSNKKWIASIKINQKSIYLGSFINEVDAAKAYDKKAKELFGKYAKLNFV